MKVRIDQIKDVAKEFTVIEPAASFAMLADMEANGECRFDASIETQLAIRHEVDHYRVEGTVVVPVTLTCSRCLATYQDQIASRFTIIFRQGAAASEEEDEVELAEQDLISATFSGDEIDLLPEIGEQVALAIPVKPLCSKECKGLCAVCGADLNVAPCTCSQQPVNLKFAALKDFKVRH